MALGVRRTSRRPWSEVSGYLLKGLADPAKEINSDDNWELDEEETNQSLYFYTKHSSGVDG